MSTTLLLLLRALLSIVLAHGQHQYAKELPLQKKPHAAVVEQLVGAARPQGFLAVWCGVCAAGDKHCSVGRVMLDAEVAERSFPSNAGFSISARECCTAMSEEKKRVVMKALLLKLIEGLCRASASNWQCFFSHSCEAGLWFH